MIMAGLGVEATSRLTARATRRPTMTMSCGGGREGTSTECGTRRGASRSREQEAVDPERCQGMDANTRSGVNNALGASGASSNGPRRLRSRRRGCGDGGLVFQSACAALLIAPAHFRTEGRVAEGDEAPCCHSTTTAFPPNRRLAVVPFFFRPRILLSQPGRGCSGPGHPPRPKRVESALASLPSTSASSTASMPTKTPYGAREEDVPRQDRACRDLGILRSRWWCLRRHSDHALTRAAWRGKNCGRRAGIPRHHGRAQSAVFVQGYYTAMN